MSQEHFSPEPGDQEAKAESHDSYLEHTQPYSQRLKQWAEGINTANDQGYSKAAEELARAQAKGRSEGEIKELETKLRLIEAELRGLDWGPQ